MTPSTVHRPPPWSITCRLGLGRKSPSVNAAAPPLAASSGESCSVTEKAMTGVVWVRCRVTGMLTVGLQPVIGVVWLTAVTVAGPRSGAKLAAMMCPALRSVKV